MYHQVLMGVLNSGADVAEQFEALADIEFSLVTPAVNRLAIDQLHDKVRQPLFGTAAVEEPRNIGMIERCQDLALAAKPLQDFTAVLFGVNDFDGHLLAICAIGALRQVDGAHASAPDLPDQFVPAQLPALHTGCGFRHSIKNRPCRAEQRAGEPFRQVLTRAQQTLYLLPEIPIGLAFLLQKRFPRRWVHLQSSFINSPNSTEAFRRHRTSLWGA
jgi:hypothetical protein